MTVTLPTTPDGRKTIGVLDLDVLFFPLFILIRWLFDRSAGGTPGRWLARIAVVAPDAASLSRRYGVFALPYAPGVALMGSVSVIGFATGDVPPLLAALTWFTTNILVLASDLAAGLAILGRRDAFYDASSGTAVLPRSALPATAVVERPLPSRAEASIASGRRRIAWASCAFAAGMTAVFLAELLLPAEPSGPGGVATETLVAFGAMDRALVVGSGQAYRLFTAIFLHGSITHLTLNLVVLLVSGWMFEGIVGSRWCGTVFLLGGLAASAASIAINAAEQVSAGASGATLALGAALLVVSKRASPGPRRDAMRAWPLATALAALLPPGLLPDAVAVDRADHVGGTLAGVLIGGVILLSWPKHRPRPSGGVVSLGIAGVVVSAVLVSSVLTGVTAPRATPRLVPPGEAPRTEQDWLSRGPGLAERFPDDPRALLSRSQVEAMGGNGPDASRDIDAAVAAAHRLPAPASSGFAFHARAAVGSRFFEAGDLDRAIAQYDEALSDPAAIAPAERALATRQRGIAEFFRHRPIDAATDLDRAVRLAPSEAYAALWDAIVRARTGGEASPRNLTGALAGEDWPTPVLRFYLGEIDAAQLDQAVGAGDPRLFPMRRCEADLYLGEWHVMQHELDAARPLLEGAARECPHDFIEYRASREELSDAGSSRPPE